MKWCHFTPWVVHFLCLKKTSADTYPHQGCVRLMSGESNLTRLWLKWVESKSSRLWKSRIWVESESNHADRHFSQSWVNWMLVESKLSHWFFLRENVEILHLSVVLQGKNHPTAIFDRTPPPSGQQLLPKSGKMWWVVRQIWLNSDSNELRRSWVRVESPGLSHESESSQPEKSESSTTLILTHQLFNFFSLNTYLLLAVVNIKYMRLYKIGRYVPIFVLQRFISEKRLVESRQVFILRKP